MIALKIALDVQMGFQWAFKIVRWWAPLDRIRQSVLSTRTGHGKGAVAQCRASHSRHGQVCRGGRAQATSWLMFSTGRMTSCRYLGADPCTQLKTSTQSLYWMRWGIRNQGRSASSGVMWPWSCSRLWDVRQH